MNGDRPDLARSALQLLAVGALLATSFWIVRPFLVALTWATTIAIATWPLLVHLESWFGGRRAIAATFMTLGLLAVVVAPLYFGISTIVANSDDIATWSRSLAAFTIPEPPSWLASIPVFGQKLAIRWHEIAAAGPAGISSRLAPISGEIALWFAVRVGDITQLLIHLLLTLIITAILYAQGEAGGRALVRVASRLAGPQGEKSLRLAAQAVRAVAIGVIGTAAIQSLAAGIGLALVGVPFAAILTVVMFLLAVAQIGAGPVLLIAVVWAFRTQSGVVATAFLVWSIVCGTLDNFLRPLLMKRGIDLPMPLIFVGVIGGLVAFGVLGLFIGPVVLAVGYTLLDDWVKEQGDVIAPSVTAHDEAAGRDDRAERNEHQSGISGSTSRAR